jgi:hypothetical protein
MQPPPLAPAQLARPAQQTHNVFLTSDTHLHDGLSQGKPLLASGSTGHEVLCKLGRDIIGASERNLASLRAQCGHLLVVCLGRGVLSHVADCRNSVRLYEGSGHSSAYKPRYQTQGKWRITCQHSDCHDASLTHAAMRKTDAGNGQPIKRCNRVAY